MVADPSESSLLSNYIGDHDDIFELQTPLNHHYSQTGYDEYYQPTTLQTPLNHHYSQTLMY